MLQTAPERPTQQQITKVAVASIVGSVIEQFDFLVTGVIAATIWGGVFFKLPGLAAVAAAIGVYGIGIVIRPIGAYIFGHIADRYGRKDALVYALVLMGVSTLLIGLTPGYDTIGAPAAILLIVFRLAQGISFGAEFGTAATWVVEQAANSKYRAFWGAWVGFAIPIGLLLGFGSVIAVKSLMTPAQFAAYRDGVARLSHALDLAEAEAWRQARAAGDLPRTPQPGDPDAAAQPAGPAWISSAQEIAQNLTQTVLARGAEALARATAPRHQADPAAPEGPAASDAPRATTYPDAAAPPRDTPPEWPIPARTSRPSGP